jgi:hypothetical protein
MLITSLQTNHFIISDIFPSFIRSEISVLHTFIKFCQPRPKDAT